MIIVITFLFLPLTYVYTASQGRYKDGLMEKFHLVEDDKIMRNTEKCMFGICEDVPSYPEAEIENMIKNNYSALYSYFGGSVIEPFGTSLRTGRINQEAWMPFCKTNDRSTLPKKIVDIDGVDRLIANVKSYSQVVKFQVCSNENRECYIGNIFGYKTFCVQKYNIIKLVAVNYPRSLEYRKFRIPSTCVCHYSSVDSDVLDKF